MTDLTLIDKDKSYSLNVGLVAPSSTSLDEFDLCTLVPLASSNKTTNTYSSGDSFTLTQDASFDVSSTLASGTYYLVAYVATEDDLPISVINPIVLDTDLSATVDTIGLTISLDADNKITFTYGSQASSITSTLEAKDSYTYEEISTFLLNAVINLGTPITEEFETYDAATDTWSTAKAGSTITPCQIRMQYTKTTETGQTETSYLNIDLTALQ